MSQTTKTFATLNEVLAELGRAEKLFPTWPDNPIEQAAIVAEEAGEAIQAALNMRPNDPHNGTLAAFRKELVQTAAMAFRALINLPEPE